MPIKKVLFVMAICLLISSCASTRYPAYQEAMNGSTTDRGMHYLLGRGVVQDNRLAFNYFKQAADQENDPIAQNQLAYLYASGKGTRRDYTKAMTYYKKAARSGLASAQFNIAMMYEHGLGVAKNKTVAHEWYRKAATLGFEPAKLTLQQYTS